MNCPLDIRRRLWKLLSSEWKPADLEQLVDQEVTLADLPSAFEKILAGKMTGRTLVKVK